MASRLGVAQRVQKHRVALRGRWIATGPDLGARQRDGPGLRDGMSAPVPGLAKGSSRKQYAEVACKGADTEGWK